MTHAGRSDNVPVRGAIVPEVVERTDQKALAALAPVRPTGATAYTDE